VGLGDQKPVDEGKNAAARARNRCVEVKVFTVDQAAAEQPKTSE
jgi:outer membrane protein OmpA-like peptidoglycan-associated protein